MTDDQQLVVTQAELKRNQWENRLEKMKVANANEQSRQNRTARFKKISKNPLTIAFVACALIAIGWYGVSSYATVGEAAQNAMDDEQMAMENDQQQQKVANKVADQLRGCLGASEFTVDFDGLGVPLLTKDLRKVDCASTALLGSSELPAELVNFAQSTDERKTYANQIFKVGNGKISVTINRGGVV